MRFDPRHVAAALLGVSLLGVAAAPASAQKNPPRDALFGETHVHTSCSFDAYIFGNTMRLGGARGPVGLGGRKRRAGNELLAISHNANLSDGSMFPMEVDFKGRPIDKAWAESRERNERLTEIIGIAAAVFALVALGASFVVPLRAVWARVVVRVAGSGIAAIGLLLLGWGLRPGA